MTHRRVVDDQRRSRFGTKSQLPNFIIPTKIKIELNELHKNKKSPKWSKIKITFENSNGH